MRIERYSFGKLSVFWVRRVVITPELLQRLIRLFASRYIVVALTALDLHGDLMDRVNENPSVLYCAPPDQESITAETLIAADTEEVLSLANLISVCDARSITFYGLDKSLPVDDYQAFRGTQPEALVINGEVKYCVSAINEECVISIMFNRSIIEAKTIAAELKALFK